MVQFPALELFPLCSSGSSSYLLLFPECLILNISLNQTLGSWSLGSAGTEVAQLAVIALGLVLQFSHKLGSGFSAAPAGEGPASVLGSFKTCWLLRAVQVDSGGEGCTCNRAGFSSHWNLHALLQSSSPWAWSPVITGVLLVHKLQDCLIFMFFIWLNIDKYITRRYASQLHLINIILHTRTNGGRTNNLK